MTTSTLSQKFKNYPEIWIGILALLVRLLFLNSFSDSPFFEPIKNGNDRSLYSGLAQSVANGQIFPSGVFEYMPLYPWVLGVICFIFGPKFYLVGAAALGAILDSVTAFLIVRLARGLGAPVRAAIVMGLFYAFYPVAIIYSVVTMANSLNAFLLLFFVALLIKLQDEMKPSMLKWFGLGFLAGATALSFAGMLLIFILSLAYQLFLQIRSRTIQFPSLVLCLLGFILPILPVTIHNWNAGHQFVLITAHGGFNFYMGNHENATGYPVQIKEFRGDAGSLLVDARIEAEKTAGKKLNSAEFSKFWSDRAWDFICTHPWDELKLLGIKFLKFWNRTEYDDMRLLPMFTLNKLFFSSRWWPGFGWISFFGFLGLVLSNPKCRPVKLVVLTGMIGVLGFFITTRYRLTMAPLLCVLGAFGLEGIRSWLQPSSKSIGFRYLLGPVLIVFILGAGLVFAPLANADFRTLDYYNSAAHLVAQKRYPEALEQANQGIKIVPMEPQLHFVAGNALYGQGKYKEAVRAFENVLRLKPNHASAHYNLAMVWLKLNEPAKALAEAEFALRDDPQHPEAAGLIKEIQIQSKK